MTEARPCQADIEEVDEVARAAPGVHAPFVHRALGERPDADSQRLDAVAVEEVLRHELAERLAEPVGTVRAKRRVDTVGSPRAREEADGVMAARIDEPPPVARAGEEHVPLPLHVRAGNLLVGVFGSHGAREVDHRVGIRDELVDARPIAHIGLHGYLVLERVDPFQVGAHERVTPLEENRTHERTHDAGGACQQ